MNYFFAQRSARHLVSVQQGLLARYLLVMVAGVQHLVEHYAAGAYSVCQLIIRSLPELNRD